VSVARKKPDSVKAAVEAYLDGVRLEGAQKPLGALAIVLAESLENAPEYAKGKLARELRELLVDLDEKAACDSELAERRAARDRENRQMEERRARLAADA
jgi:hypothetical protein